MPAESRSPEITDLTICRAAFAAWVFVYHVDLCTGFSGYLTPFAGLVRHGYLGVDGFFLLSGMILARVHPELVERPDLAKMFWGRRLARIYPVHLATIVVLAVLVLTGLALGFAERAPERFTIGSLVANLLLVHGWGFSNFLAWNYPSWSVSTEWAGYLMFPAIWYFVGRWDLIITTPIMVIALTSIGAVAYFSGVGLNLTYGGALFRFVPEFVAGIAACRIVPAYADEMPARMLAFVGIGGAAMGAWLGSDTVVVVMLLLVIVAVAMRADGWRPPVFGTARLPLFFGQLSYAFYMSFATAELLVTQAFRHAHVDPAGEKLLFAAAMTVLSLAYAIILHVFIEVPARRAADRFLAAPAPLAGRELRL
jgi:peptidoglycan/LPS O-acetylase OafA/YrhL